MRDEEGSIVAANTVTYYREATAIRAMRSLGLQVELDGQGAPWLRPVAVERHRNEAGIEARFRISRGGYEAAKGVSSGGEMVRAGQRVRVTMMMPEGAGTGRLMGWPLFDGVVAGQKTVWRGDEDGAEVWARAVGVDGQGVISGVRARGRDGMSVYLAGEETVFNADGQPNASATPTVVGGEMRQVFEGRPGKAVFWTHAGAIGYLVAEYLGAWTAAGSDESGYAAAVIGDSVPRNLDVTSLTPLAALARVCADAGASFTVVQAPVGEEVATGLRFSRPGHGRRVFWRHQRRGEKLDLGRSNVAAVAAESEWPDETVVLTGYGDYRRYEATFELVGGWPAALEADDYERYSPATNADFAAVEDVFRKWVLNEAGDYSAMPYERGPAYDFGAVLGGEWASRRRRFWPCLSRTAAGQSLGYFVEVSYDGGATWAAYTSGFDNLLGECGVYLNFEQFPPQMWIAIRKDALRVRITASVAADERLAVTLHEGAVNAGRPERRVTADYGREFEYRQVTTASRFYGAGGAALGAPDSVDDTAALRGRVREVLAQLSENRRRGEVMMPWWRPDVWPGDEVEGIAGRGLDLGGRSGGARRIRPVVQSVTLQLDGAPRTIVRYGGG